MRIVVTGASGNVGTSVLARLAADESVAEIVGMSRRVPPLRLPKVTWHPADVGIDALTPIFAGADALIHLAWMIQPARDEAVMERTNVTGTRRVVEAVLAAGVPTLVHASSVGTYARGPKNRPVDESWPATGVAPGWVDLAVDVPTMDTAAARTDLGWTPEWSATDTLDDLLDGFARHAGLRTAPLHPDHTRATMPPAPATPTSDDSDTDTDSSADADSADRTGTPDPAQPTRSRRPSGLTIGPTP